MQYKILIVEMIHTDNNQLLVQVLTASDYKSIQAFSKTEALLLLEKETPDLMPPGISAKRFYKRYARTKG